MCRAFRVLCAAPDSERLAALKRAAVSSNWELVGGVRSLDELTGQVAEWQPDVVVVDAALGPDGPRRARAARDRIRVVSVGPLPGVDEAAVGLDDLRRAILALPRPGGPVRS